MKGVTLLIFILCSLQIQATKRALIIAVGDYPRESHWGNISSVNDVPLIKNSLTNNGFLDEDIMILFDADATKQGILIALEKLQSQIKKGDIVVIHYSGHGQQIFDDSGDEIDDLDEALVPYDAYAYYTDGYKGENHLRDDEIGNIISNFRNKLGTNGQLLVLIDSCHSGSSTRASGESRGGRPAFVPANWTQSTSEKAKGSAMFESVNLDENAAPFVMITGASANELNYEYEGYGSLSYAFSKAMTELGSDFTYRQLFNKISANMNVITPNQTPTIEGNIDYKLFRGEYVAQQQYYEINQITAPNIIQINNGKLNGLFNNTTVNIMPAGVSKVDASKIISTGKITNANFNSATIKLDKPLDGINEKNYWVFINKLSYGDDNYALKVFMDETIEDNTIKDGISEYLAKNQIGEIVQDILKSDVIITKEKTNYVLNSSKGIAPIDNVSSSRGVENLDLINQKLFNYAHGQYLKNLSLKNHDYEFEFKLLPIDFNQDKNRIEAFKPENSFYSDIGIFEVKPNESWVLLQVTNKSNKPIYFSIIEINSKGEINPFLPNNNCKLNDNERKLEPGKTMIFKDCVYQFGPPYERLILKGFATSTPINFQPTVETRGQGSTRSAANPLEKFIKQTYTQTRGASTVTNTSSGVDGYSTEFVYEIVK